MTNGSSTKLVHSVYFSLNDHTAQARDHFIKICQRYLTDHPGQISFMIGPRNDSIHRNVSDLKYDVAMTIAFDSFKAFENYHSSARHGQFMETIGSIPNTVRVFDSYLV